MSHTVVAYTHPTVVRPRHETDHITTMLVPELDEFALAVRDGRAPSITAADGRGYCVCSTPWWLLTPGRLARIG